MSTQSDLLPEEFGAAAGDAIRHALDSAFADQAGILAEAGLFAITLPEDAGGMGLDLTFVLPVAKAAGALQLRWPLVEQILLAQAFAGSEIGDALVAGDKIGTIVWGGAGSAGFVDQADYVLIAQGEGAALYRRDGLEVEIDAKLDPDFPQATVAAGASVPVANLSVDAFAALRQDALALQAAFAIGAGIGALDQSVAYMQTRVQFGRPLSAKQAVRHHLARMKMLSDISEATLTRAFKADEFGTKRGVETAFAAALANAIFITEKAIHLHGGMGFTWELPLHYSLRDLRKIDAAFKTSKSLQAIGQAFIDAA